MLEICQNAAGSTDLAKDHRGYDGPSWTSSFHTYTISSDALFITLDGKYDGSSRAQRSVKGVRSKTFELLEYGYWDYFSEHHDEPAERTVIDSTDGRGLRNPTLDLPIFLQQLHYAATYGPSQTRRSVEGLRSKTLKLLEYG